MIDILRQHILARVGDQADQLDEVLAQFRPVTARRNAQILRQGDICRQVYFLASGCLQIYVYDSKYNETTRDIEDCELLGIGFAEFHHTMETVPAFGHVYQQILESSYANSVGRINTLVSLGALERIKWLVDTRPALMSRVPGKTIASYLGISQETYSRLKRKA